MSYWGMSWMDWLGLEGSCNLQGKVFSAQLHLLEQLWTPSLHPSAAASLLWEGERPRGPRPLGATNDRLTWFQSAQVAHAMKMPSRIRAAPKHSQYWCSAGRLLCG